MRQKNISIAFVGMIIIFSSECSASNSAAQKTPGWYSTHKTVLNAFAVGCLGGVALELGRRYLTAAPKSRKHDKATHRGKRGINIRVTVADPKAGTKTMRLGGGKELTSPGSEAGSVVSDLSPISAEAGDDGSDTDEQKVESLEENVLRRFEARQLSPRTSVFIERALFRATEYENLYKRTHVRLVATQRELAKYRPSL